MEPTVIHCLENKEDKEQVTLNTMVNNVNNYQQQQLLAVHHRQTNRYLAPVEKLQKSHL